MEAKFLRIVNANAAADICGPCGGKCCHGMPGSLLPADLDEELRPKVVLAKAVELLKTGRYSIDWWEGNPMREEDDQVRGEYAKGFYLRPATKGSEGMVFHDSWGGACTFVTDTGCSLSEEDRPSECKMLIPRANEKCGYPEGWENKRSVAQAWWPFRFLLEDVNVEEIEEALAQAA